MSDHLPPTKDSSCVFCKIVAGEIPASIYWENSDFMAFLSIDPNTEGFSCVIPKNHYNSDVLKMPDAILQKFVLVAKKVSGILENYFKDVGRVGLIMEGTGINHAHIKLIPMHGTQWMKSGEWKQIPSNKKLWFNTYEGWLASAGGPMADPEKLQELAKSIKKHSSSQ